MRIETIPIEQIKPAAYNPRKDLKPGNPEYEALRRSIDRWDLVEPLVWNERSGNLVGGHQRLKILIARGDSAATVSVVDLDDDDEKALNVALNNINGDWDEEMLAKLLEDLRSHDFDVTLTGFNDGEVDSMIGKEEPRDGVDDVPVVDPGATITRRGDLWLLGDHRLLCGDSTNEDDVLRLMDGKKARLVATDPPYCVDYTGADRPNGGKDWSQVFDEVSIKDPVAFWLASLGLAIKVSHDDAPWYVWHAHKRVPEMLRVWEQLSLLCHQQIIWVKPLAAFGRSYWGWQHEPCLFGWKEGNRPPHDGDMKSHTTVWHADYQRSFDFRDGEGHSRTDVWPLDWEGKQRPDGDLHATQKPVEIFAIPMRKHTKPGDVCYEPFSGSGSQIIAGQILRRRVYAMEITPLFVDVAVKRWEALTGQTAQRIPGDGAPAEEPQEESGPPQEAAPPARRRRKAKA